MKRIAILIAAVALAAGCAGQSMLNGSPAANQPDTAGQLSAVFERITGTREDRAAAALRQYVAYQGPIRECMARHGFDYSPPPFDDPFKSWPANRPMSYIDVLIPIDDQQTARGLYLAEDYRSPQAQPPANPGYEKLDEAGRKRYVSQAGACSPAPASYANEFPDGSLNLAYQLEATLSKAIGKSQQLRDMATTGYTACMTQAGYPVKDRKELADHLHAKHFAAIGADVQLQAARDAEVAGARADALCRKDSYPMALTLAAPALAAFEQDHATELTQLDAGWAKIRDEADRAKAKVNW